MFNFPTSHGDQQQFFDNLSAQITEIAEASSPFYITSDDPPTQKDWEAAWVADGRNLPIPINQKLFWHDGTTLRAQFSIINNDNIAVVVPSSKSVGWVFGSDETVIVHSLWWNTDYLFYGLLEIDGDIGLYNVYPDGSYDLIQDMTSDFEGRPYYSGQTNNSDEWLIYADDPSATSPRLMRIKNYNPSNLDVLYFYRILTGLSIPNGSTLTLRFQAGNTSVENQTIRVRILLNDTSPSISETVYDNTFTVNRSTPPSQIQITSSAITSGTYADVSGRVRVEFHFDAGEELVLGDIWLEHSGNPGVNIFNHLSWEQDSMWMVESDDLIFYDDFYRRTVGHFVDSTNYTISSTSGDSFPSMPFYWDQSLGYYFYTWGQRIYAYTGVSHIQIFDAENRIANSTILDTPMVHNGWIYFSIGVDTLNQQAARQTLAISLLGLTVRTIDPDNGKTPIFIDDNRIYFARSSQLSNDVTNGFIAELSMRPTRMGFGGPSHYRTRMKFQGEYYDTDDNRFKSDNNFLNFFSDIIVPDNNDQNMRMSHVYNVMNDWPSFGTSAVKVHYMATNEVITGVGLKYRFNNLMTPGPIIQRAPDGERYLINTECAWRESTGWAIVCPPGSSTYKIRQVSEWIQPTPDYIVLTEVTVGAETQPVIDLTQYDLREYDILLVTIDTSHMAGATANSAIHVRFNSDNNISNYYSVVADQSAATVTYTDSFENRDGIRFPATNSVLESYQTMWIPNFKSPYWKRCIFQGGYTAAASTTNHRAQLGHGIWKSTNPIETLTITQNAATTTVAAGFYYKVAALRTKGRYHRDGYSSSMA